MTMNHPAHNTVRLTALPAWVALGSTLLGAVQAPVPDKLVVLTFDDSVASHYSVVRPMLQKYGFTATFFITEGFSFPTNKQDYMTWAQIAELDRDRFEIGNHTRDHLSVDARNLDQLTEQIEAISARCLEQGIPRPVSFAYPGNAIHPDALPVLRRLGIRFARRGGAPEHPYEWGRGFAFEPGVDHPLLIPSAGDARPDWTLDDFKRAVDQARGGRVAVLQFHGVPDREHPWVNTRPERFEEFMRYLRTNAFQVIALRDLARYVDPERTPPDPLAIVERRKSERKEVLVEGQVVNAADGRAVPARVSIQSADGAWHFVKTGFGRGSAVRYERRSGFNTNAVEMHTTLPASPFRVELFPGRCTFAVEHGKEFFGETREVEVAPGMAELTFRLRRWVDMAELGWFCGDTHVHREPADLANVMPAEDVNVAFPMVYWTTDADIAPGRGDKNIKGEFPAAPVALDATHVYYPRNTEYEIFTTGGRSHTLGALLALNHRTVFDLPALPIGRVAERAHAEGALLDLEKHNWPWSMALVPLVRPDLFELANNHHWQTAFSITNWAVSAPAWMQVGRGSDNEREWTLYGFLNYYALLDCGFRLSPAAGTANGVHPVSLGFSRVYVHLPRGFSYDAWVNGLKAGHSFVTTGPMLLATVNGEDAGYTFKIVPPTNGPQRFRVKGDVVSAEPSRKIEIIVNGQAVRTINAVPDRLPSGAHNSHFDEVVELAGSGWIAARCWEERAEGRFRFAHTAPWFVDMAGRPLRPRREEAEFLVKRTEEEIARNSTVLSSEALADYRRALSAYRDIARTAK